MWDKLDQSKPPDLQAVAEYIASPLWPGFLVGMEEGYQLRPEPSYSRCSMLMGWNFKFRKAGRALCTVYPMAGYFSALVALGSKEAEAAEQLLPSLSAYTQKVHAESRPLNGTRWLMLEVTAPEILDDLRQLLALRRSPKKSC
jgi:hypothetical protein